LTEDEKKRLVELQAQKRAALAQIETTGAAPLLKNKPVLDELEARLRYVCRLVLRERRPYCPINGLLVLVPLAALKGDNEASQLATLVQSDAQTAREVFQLECSTVLLVTDLERATGFGAYLEETPPGQRELPLGQAFALLPDVDVQEVPGMFEQGITRLCQDRLFATLTPKFRLEPSQGETPGKPGPALRKNFHLYQFWDLLRQGRKRLARLAQRSAQTEPAPPMLAGVFLAGTGDDALHQQAFVSGVIRLLVQHQNSVTWTPQAIAEERSFVRMTRIGYVGFLLLLIALGGVGYWFWNR
jgi:type VI protein secretion system component VasK